MNKDKLIPELRFPEFLNTEDWNEVEFGELLSLLSDYTANGSFASLKENVQYYTSEEYAVLVRTTDLEKKEFTPARFTDKRGYDFLSKTSLFGGEIIMANVGSIGKVYKAPFYDKPMTLAPNTYVLKFKKGVDEEFIYQLMLRTEFEQKLLSMVGSSTLKAINKKNLRSIEIAIPKSNEQQKIASCLSSLDEILAAHNDKLDALKDHKKGLLQNLFPQEGETVPKVRFPEFEDDGEWVESNIQSLLDNKIIISHLDGNHGALYPRAEEFSEDGVPYLTANDFISGTVDFRYCKHLPLERAKKFKKGVAKNGDILFAHNATVGPVAKLITDLPFVILSTTATYYRCDNESLINDFLRYALESPFFVAQYTRVMSQSTRNQVPITTQRKFNLQLPAPMEQQKIASCLSAVDELITAQQEKIEQLQQHKKGLMQGLFPKIER